MKCNKKRICDQVCCFRTGDRPKMGKADYLVNRFVLQKSAYLTRGVVVGRRCDWIKTYHIIGKSCCFKRKMPCRDNLKFVSSGAILGHEVRNYGMEYHENRFPIKVPWPGRKTIKAGSSQTSLWLTGQQWERKTACGRSYSSLCSAEPIIRLLTLHQQNSRLKSEEYVTN